ncbi:hypothetical protein N9N67_03970 [Bacteriovoracaceae bacterium]|nr:hypothetical protein [Bacteriovoracaceae bacterium]
MKLGLVIFFIFTLITPQLVFANKDLKYNYKVLKCVDSVLSQNKSLTNNEVSSLNSFLDQIDIKSPNKQKRNLKRCKKIRKAVKKYARPQLTDEDIKLFILESDLNNKDFLTNLIFPEKLECGGKEMSASIAWLWGVKLGANVIVCNYSNHTKRVWFGPHLGVQAGVGAMISYREIKNEGYSTIYRPTNDLEYGSLIKSGDTYSSYTKKNRMNYAIFYGKEAEVDIVFKAKGEQARWTGHNVGFGYIYQGATIGGGIKVREKRNWKKVFDSFINKED